MTGGGDLANPRRVKVCKENQGTPARALSVAPAPRTLGVIAVLPLALAACAGPAKTTAIEGEPVCPDFEVGAAHTKMNGSLRFPVFLSIKSGSQLVFKTTIMGRRTEASPNSRILLADDNETFTVEWAQCENERAPVPLEAVGRGTKDPAKYECGKSTVYKTEELVTKKGDPKTHVLTFQPPPNGACLQTVAPSEAPDAGAPDAAADASSESADGGGDPDGGATGAAADGGSADGGSPDGGPASDGGTGAPDAGPSDAGATKAK